MDHHRPSEDTPRARPGRLRAVEDACRLGDLDAFRTALGDPPGFPGCVLAPDLFVLGTRPLDVAIRLGPVAFIEHLLRLGADPRALAADGFPPLFQAIDAQRDDRHAVLTRLLDSGADPEQRGLNDGTALHHAVSRHDIDAVRVLLEHGADPSARTGIDDRSTPLEDAASAGFTRAVEELRRAMSMRGSRDPRP